MILPKTLVKTPSLVNIVLGQLPTVLTNIASLSVYSHINLSVFSTVFSFLNEWQFDAAFALLHSTSTASSIMPEITVLRKCNRPVYSREHA